MYYRMVQVKSKLISSTSLSKKFKALGDTTRLELVIAVLQTQGQVACVCDLTPATGLSQGTVSHHLKVLVDAGLLNRSHEGRWSYYSPTPETLILIKSLGIPISKAKKSPSKNC